jgi:GAF domain-containing protein
MNRLEVEIAREIARLNLTASSPTEVYRAALSRISPLLGAEFASVFLRDEQDPSLLRLACAHNWPQKSARFLGEMRIREGRGPTGRAVETGQPVYVVDLYENAALRDWWEPARELGFVSMIALPLAAGGGVLGAISFYFRERQTFDEPTRALLEVVAHQLAATADQAGDPADPARNHGTGTTTGTERGSR